MFLISAVLKAIQVSKFWLAEKYPMAPAYIFLLDFSSSSIISIALILGAPETVPAGTVTGAPKIRAMEIIDELEKSKRKMYAGSIGYFSANKNFDTCIALRTALIKDNKFYIQSGAGIVADSIPEKEYLETVNKAKALINSLN